MNQTTSALSSIFFAKQTLGLFALVLGLTGLALSAGCEPVGGPEGCCACLQENVCIATTDEEQCVTDLEAGEHPDRNERPFGEGISVNRDCEETQCGSCLEAVLDAAGDPAE